METAPPDPTTAALAARIEEVCLNAWPALQEIHYDGWLIRLADGQTRRTNSVNVLHDGALPPHEKIAYCEAVYRRHALPPHFRILSTSNGALDRLLAANGYVAQDETSTLFMDFRRHAPVATSRAVELVADAPSAEWLRARSRISGQTPGEMHRVEKILHQLALPSVFAAVRDEWGQICSIAKGAVHDGVVCLNMVATDPVLRRRGYSRDCVSAILMWAAREVGASAACLQVVSANTPAITLYRQLGFSQELYRYHYRSLVNANAKGISHDDTMGR